MPSSPLATKPRSTLNISVQSRECSTLLLEHLPGSTLFPERGVGASIINALGQPNDTVICITAPRMEDVEAQIAYYTELAATAAGAVGASARAAMRSRVTVLSLDDSSPRWLSEKLLDQERPDARAAREHLVKAAATARASGSAIRLSYFEPSENLERLAEEIGIPGDQAAARHIPLGKKAAGRHLFEGEGIKAPAGTEECFDTDRLVQGICGLVDRGHRRFVLKLSSTAYAGGLGNALLDLSDLPDDAPIASAVRERLPDSQVLDASLGWEGFQAAIPQAGVIAEELLTGDELRSPSYQGRISDGAVVTISTHEQVFGPNGQTFTGSAFPAIDDYRNVLIDHGRRIGTALTRLGVAQGDFGVDFVAVRREGAWDVYGIELNLRATGTLHAFNTVTGLLRTTPAEDGVLHAADRSLRTYLASDSITSSAYRGLRPSGLIDLVRASPLHWDQERGQGVVLHMLSALPRYGKFGATCVGVDRDHATDLMSRLRTLVDDWAGRNL
ncbi:peptide ligase PGM1-related protein [Streptomyces sp. SCL15-4]|uniref:peptide ligase PGM1-related protein n=1 Tax=Streptomyces sp. SCL15-4 TaxID=2967221 RepID=UPI0029669E0F|nr:peptide ligase PGM1-related protein [Streptomyces sp. SCL15-4]